MRMRLNKFDPSAVKPHRTYLIIGKRGSGKSVLLDELMYKLNASQQYDFCMAFTPTMDTRETFEKSMPSSWIHDSFDGGRIEQLVSLQRATPKGKKRSILLVLDDMMADKRFTRSIAIRDIFFNGRHEHLTAVFTQQYCCDLSPDYVIIFKDNVLANKQRLHKFFFGMLPFPDFCTVMDRTCADYGCLVLDNTSKSTDPAEQLSWYRAQPDAIPAYRIGKEVFWRLHAQQAKSREAIVEEQADQRKLIAMAERGKTKDRVVVVEKRDEHGKLVDVEDEVALLAGRG